MSNDLINYIDTNCQNGNIELPFSNHLKEGLILLLKDLVTRKNKGGSTSIKVDTAESLFKSILYAIDFFIENTGADKLDVLKMYNVKDIYDKGLDNLVQYFNETKIFFTDVVLKNHLNIENISYNDVFNDDIPDFFSEYDLVFDANSTVCNMDYPILFDNSDLEGIKYIRNYLEKINYENIFSNLFTKNDIENLLKSHGRIYKLDYRELRFNIFEVLLNNAIFAYNIVGQVGSLILSNSKVEALFIELNNFLLKGENSLTKHLEDIFTDFIAAYNLAEPVRTYIEAYRKTFINQTLIKVVNRADFIVLPDFNELIEDNTFILKKGKRMKNEIFRFIVESINKNPDINEKISIIKTNVSSLEDFVDILKADCLYNDEFILLYQSLSDLEISLLTRLIVNENISDEGFNLENLIHTKLQQQNIWETKLIEHLKSMTAENLACIQINMQKLA